MSKADRLKEEIGVLKIAFGALIAVDVSLIAWLAQNFSTVTAILVVLALIAVAGTTVGIVYVSHAMFRRIARLEDL